jgi:hypothetical protein
LHHDSCQRKKEANLQLSIQREEELKIGKKK